jgi:hypothetical protein
MGAGSHQDLMKTVCRCLPGTAEENHKTVEMGSDSNTAPQEHTL